MYRLVSRSCTFLVVACALSVVAFAGGKSKTCHRCGCAKEVEHVLRLVKICKDVEIPSYVYTKEEVFYPDKGAICYTGYRRDTFYNFWRPCDCSKTDDPSQQSTGRHLTPLNCSSYTVCGCKTVYGAKSTGCHSGCGIRVPSKTQHVTTPVLQWETVPLCKDCCESEGKKK